MIRKKSWNCVWHDHELYIKHVYILGSGRSKALADPRRPLEMRAPSRFFFFLISCSFRDKIYKIIGWYTPLGLAPHSGKSCIRHCICSITCKPTKGQILAQKGAADPKLSVRFNDLKMLSSWVVNMPKNV